MLVTKLFDSEGWESGGWIERKGVHDLMNIVLLR